MRVVGSSPRLGWETLKSHFCWVGNELFGGLAVPFTHCESTFGEIAGAGDKDDLSAAPQTGLISKWRYLDSLHFAQFSAQGCLTAGRQFSVCRNAQANGECLGLKCMISMFLPFCCH